MYNKAISGEWPALSVDHRLRPVQEVSQAAFRFLSGQLGDDEVCVRIYSGDDGGKYWLFYNPWIPAMAKELHAELHGLLLLFTMPTAPREGNSQRIDLLRDFFGEHLITPQSKRWARVQHFLQRVRFLCRKRELPQFLLGVHLPNSTSELSERRKLTLSHDLAMTGGLWLASDVAHTLSEKAAGSWQLNLRPDEILIIDRRVGRTRMIFVERFKTGRDRVFAAWIMKQIVRQRDSAQALKTWRWELSLTPLKHPLIHDRKTPKEFKLWFTWEFDLKALGEVKATSWLVIAFLAVAFNPFLRRSLTQLKALQDRELRREATSLLDVRLFT